MTKGEGVSDQRGRGSDQREGAVTKREGEVTKGEGAVTKGEGAVTKGEGGSDQGEGAVTKAFFPSVKNRLRQKIPTFPDFITTVTGHGKLRSYLHRFGLIDNTIWRCEEEREQTANHLIFQCKKLRMQRNEIIKQIETFVATGRRQMKYLSTIIYKFLYNLSNP